ncbi:DUF1835 domain-containing protein [Zunongwangia endophytica]|uniref:DUF1835 domain-containing protein n=1 Tax=Zunongwangia endophytica TaxID=1808945 RepID=A0ABV8HFA8_9FLAO|nr:DUF1835 domain-containing protein [Zunongwangia endophytica]MDN3594043.1 DUF1835 domain-containing protein [Zunongwangia endophytica]
MEKKPLHIINGDSLAESAAALDLPGQQIIWREMLCEGPTTQEVGSDDFIEMRSKFLHNYYGISAQDYQEKFVSELNKLGEVEDYDHIILWFEFDLFCHVNILATISFLTDKKNDVPFYLVCSKKLKGDKKLTPLSQLSEKQLLKHYQKKILLDENDIEVANLMWELYCGNNPTLLKRQIKTNTNFEYLSSCIRAHIERFPNSVTGINSLEKNILQLIKERDIHNYTQLMGYALEYQGYYGFSDIQMKRILEKLSIFYAAEDNKIQLTEKGHLILNGKKNFYRELKNDDILGGSKMYDFLYDPEVHQLLKL